MLWREVSGVYRNMTRKYLGLRRLSHQTWRVIIFRCYFLKWMLVVTSTLSSPAQSCPNICHRYYPKAREHKDLSHWEKNKCWSDSCNRQKQTTLRTPGTHAADGESVPDLPGLRSVWSKNRGRWRIYTYPLIPSLPKLTLTWILL